MGRFAGFFLGLLLSTVQVTSQAGAICIEKAGARARPNQPVGQVDPSNPIEHIVVIMQENHSFDNYFGALNSPKFYGAEVDGLRPDLYNLDSRGRPHFVFHEKSYKVTDPAHDWTAVHKSWNGGLLDGFVKSNEWWGDRARVMGYYNERDLPFYYDLANRFAIGDRYFCSALTQTYPNRFFMMAGTAFGHIKNDDPWSKSEFSQTTIFDLLTQYGVSWKYYFDHDGYIKLFKPLYSRSKNHVGPVSDYSKDLATNKLPQVVFIDSEFDKQDEHPNADIREGEKWVKERVEELMVSKAWSSSVLFLTYDENGGFFDHVAPPEACAPDKIPPMLEARSAPGDFERLGFRVPFVAVSPFAKRHFVSHRTYDHTSILRFIENKYNLPALTDRDANADPFSDIFDYR